MCVTDINEEADGSVTFLACDGQAMAMLMCGEAAGSKGRKLIHRFRYGPPTGVSFSQVAPAVCGRTLDRPLAVPDVVRWQRVHLARVGDGPWQRVEISAQPTVRFLSLQWHIPVRSHRFRLRCARFRSSLLLDCSQGSNT